MMPECLHVTNGQPARTKAFQEGLITIQDESSMIPANVLHPNPGMRVRYVCRTRWENNTSSGDHEQ